MSDVFISYSRKNTDFVRSLNDALVKDKRDVWVDWADIGRGQDWWHEIEVGVDSADTALIIVTENWLVSEICQRELEYVRKQNKRVFPIIRQKIEGDVAIRVKGTWMDQEWEQRARDNWVYLRSVNWLFFDDDTNFDNQIKDLLTALDTDQAYVKSHTRYLIKASEWQQSRHNPSFLLEGDQVQSAQEWLKSSTGKLPEPLPVHHEYVRASEVADKARAARDKAREELVKRFRQAAIVLGAGVIIAILAAVIIGQQFFSARAEVTIAVATLQQVNLHVTDAIQQQQHAIAAQQTSAAREADASTRVAVAGATLSPVPPTLTAVALAIQKSGDEQDMALMLSDASLKIAQKEPEDAVQVANDMVAAYPNAPSAYLGRGLIFAATGKQDEALKDFTAAIRLKPDDSLLYYNRAVTYGELNQLDAALADYAQAIKLQPDYGDAYFNRGAIYSDQDKRDLAIADFTQVIRIDPEAVDAYNSRGYIYDEQHLPDKALADFNQALSINPNFASAYLNRGHVYAGQGKLTDALADYWQGVQLNQTTSNTEATVTSAALPFTATVTMTTGFVERIPFEAKAGQRLSAQATGDKDSGVDPLLIVLDPQGKPLMFNDDINENNINASIEDGLLPTDGLYTLVVSYATDGSEGDIKVTLDLKSAATVTASPTPQ